MASPAPPPAAAPRPKPAAPPPFGGGSRPNRPGKPEGE
jgi:hypothetical protein